MMKQEMTISTANNIPHTMEATNQASSKSVSSVVYTIAGISTTVYGLSKVPRDINQLACVWLQHGRGGSYKDMELLAADVICKWAAFQAQSNRPPRYGIIAVSFDQRNHGSRLVNDLANEAWSSGNERHALDMYGIIQGTAIDTKLVLDHLPSYLPSSIPNPSVHMVLGISLGGHSAWHCLFNYPEFSTGVVIIGCCDYPALMADRAVKSKLASCSETDPPGISIFGSESFPDPLYRVVRKYDPASVLRTELNLQGPIESFPELASSTHEPAVSMLKDRLGGKKILNLAGADDQLVPYACSESFFNYLQSIQAQQASSDQKPISVQHESFPGVGHAVSDEMHDRAVEFLLSSLDPAYETSEKLRQASKI